VHYPGGRKNQEKSYFPRSQLAPREALYGDREPVRREVAIPAGMDAGYRGLFWYHFNPAEVPRIAKAPAEKVIFAEGGKLG